jgi:negative regulator of sigma E activity
MNESDFELELRALQPSAPSADLAERIARDLQMELPVAANDAIVPVQPARAVPVPAAGIVPRPRRAPWAWLRGLGWACAGAAAVLAIVVLMQTPPRTTHPEPSTPVLASTPEFQPAEATSELVDAEDQGFVYGEDQTAQRQIRLVYKERHSWTNPATGAVLEFEVPREDIVLMPVAMQ